MSIRSLIEINHDRAHDLDMNLASVLHRYLCSGDKTRFADELERYGIRVIASRHHSSAYYIEGDVDGFPAKYVSEQGRVVEK